MENNARAGRDAIAKKFFGGKCGVDLALAVFDTRRECGMPPLRSTEFLSMNERTQIRVMKETVRRKWEIEAKKREERTANAEKLAKLCAPPLNDGHDTVAEVFPLLASQGELPVWLQGQRKPTFFFPCEDEPDPKIDAWNLEVWPVEISIPATLQFVELLKFVEFNVLMLDINERPPWMNSISGMIYDYGDELPEVRLIVHLLRSEGICDIDYDKLKGDERETVRPLRGLHLLSMLYRELQAQQAAAEEGKQPTGENVETVKPKWNPGLCELEWRGDVVRKYRRVAQCCKILTCFEEEGWPDHILNPLGPDVDLGKAVQTLNAKLSGIRFERDGTGEGITWRPKID
jgi:hypothetical protein